MQKKQKTQLAIVGVLVIVIYFAMRVNISTVSVVSEDTNAWGDYIADKAEYISETPDIDNTVELKNVAEDIQSSSATSKQAIKKTAEYVHQNIRYKGDISKLYCYSEKASDVYEVKNGDCVSMSRLTAAILRLQGIPARTVGGCVKYNTIPSPLFALIPGPTIPKSNIFDDKKRGYLHEWVEAWTPSEGWVLVESTVGMILAKDHENYVQYAYDANPQDRCVISDQSFIEECYV